MKEKLEKMNLIKERIKEIKKKAGREGGKDEVEVKALFKEMKEVKESVVTSEKFVGKGSVSDDRQFGRKTLKTLFEDSMDLPYERFSLFQK